MVSSLALSVPGLKWLNGINLKLSAPDDSGASLDFKMMKTQVCLFLQQGIWILNHWSGGGFVFVFFNLII